MKGGGGEGSHREAENGEEGAVMGYMEEAVGVGGVGGRESLALVAE